MDSSTVCLGTSGSPPKTTNWGTTTRLAPSGGVSAGALLPHHVGAPATVERFRALIGAQEGVLYEDDILQVETLVVEVWGDRVLLDRLAVFIFVRHGGRASEPLFWQ